ncbi:unnamed protein product [Urochloa humidicola]
MRGERWPHHIRQRWVAAAAAGTTLARSSGGKERKQVGMGRAGEGKEGRGGTDRDPVPLLHKGATYLCSYFSQRRGCVTFRAASAEEHLLAAAASGGRVRVPPPSPPPVPLPPARWTDGPPASKVDDAGRLQERG